MVTPVNITYYARLNKYDASYEVIAPTEHHPDDKWTGFAPGMFDDPGLPGILHLGDSMEDTAPRSHILGVAFDRDAVNWDWVGYQDFWDTVEWRSNRLYNIRGYGGGLAFIAHPNSDFYPWSTSLLAKLCGQYDGIEVFNGAMDVLPVLPVLRWQAQATDIWTNLLKRGLDVRATAGDDFAPNIVAALDRGCVTVVADWATTPALTDEEKKAAIASALREGRFYVSYAPFPSRSGASCAPEIQGWWYDAGSSRARVQVFCPAGLDEVRFFTGTNPDHGIRVSVAAVGGQADTWEASLSCTQADKWVRMEVKDDLGWRSLTQPIWLNRVEVNSAQWPPASPGALGAASEPEPLVLDVADAHLWVSYPQTGVTTVTGELLGIAERPAAAPPLGYIGYCYSFTPAVTLQGSNSITISFDPAEVGLCREDALSIYRYDGGTGEWVAVAGSVDADANTVTAYLDRLGVYALSGALGEDATPPDIAIAVPSSGASVSGSLEIEADATDDNGVASVQFLLDDLYLGFDTTGADGWTCPLEASSYTSGTHTLTVVATDASGNESESSIEVNVSDGVPAPGITITSPSEGAILWGEVRAAGDWSGVLPFSSGIIVLGDTAVALAEPVTPSGVAWAVDSEVDFQWCGPITLTVEGADSVGNRALASATVDFRTFADIRPSFWARDHIYAAARAGVVQGYPDGLYHPEFAVTRDQMAAYIARAMAGGSVPDPECTTPPFPDVPCDFWARKHIVYCVDQNVVEGYDDGYYRPTEVVTRDQMAVYVARSIATPRGKAGPGRLCPQQPSQLPRCAADRLWR